MNVNCLDGMNIGYVGENDVTSVEFDFSDWAASYGPGILSLVIRRPMDSVPYPVVLTMDGTHATWEVSSTDMAFYGFGQGQLVYTVGTQIKKSAVFSFMVRESITGDPIPPDPFDSWIDELTQLGAYTLQNVQDAQAAANASEDSAEDSEAWAVGQRDGTDVEASDPTYQNNAKYYAGQAKDKADEITELTVSATTLEPGSPATVSYEDGNLAFGIPAGEKGDPGNPGSPGEPGHDGVTPAFSIGTVSTGAAGSDASVTMTGTQENPVLNFTIPRGDQGDPGAGDTGIIAEDYADLTFPVAKGTPCIYEGEYYVAKQDIATSESWTSAHWDQTNVGNDILSVKSALQAKLDEPSVAGTQGQVLTSDGDGGQTWETPVVPADSSKIKAGTNENNPIVPYLQHEATFYGLAKASGDSTQSASANAVGTYTDDAKKKIKMMLGIPNSTGELIYEVTTTENLTEVKVIADSNNQPFKLSKMIVIFNAPASTTGTADSFYALAYCRIGNSDTNISVPSLTYTGATSIMLAKIKVDANENMPVDVSAFAGTSAGNSRQVLEMPRNEIVEYITGVNIYQSGATKSLIPSGTNVKVYGIRIYE